MGLPGVSLGFPGVSLGKTRDSPSAPPCRITVVHTWKPGFSGEPAGCPGNSVRVSMENTMETPGRYLGDTWEIPWNVPGMTKNKKDPALTGGVLEVPG